MKRKLSILVLICSIITTSITTFNYDSSNNMEKQYIVVSQEGKNHVVNTSTMTAQEAANLK